MGPYAEDPGLRRGGPYDDRPAGMRRVTAVLGPTNTGKTHFAIDRMLAHDSGMIGFPLRLLAREIYDRICRQRPAHQVALITGEEKILPPRAVYYVCTVESMPLDRAVAFLAVDEIQLIADRDRGHVFTDRLLHARGRAETVFLGSDTARPLIRKLVPEADVITRPRFSTLRHAGPKKLTRLPRRSAVVAFSAAEVYAVAELIRRQRGGTAVVMGALSPRTRNAQIAMYQAGEVDYLVATDAIGMGLNMDLDHVAFAQTYKFDGRRVRRLATGEMGQIAGRAGRHMADGTFGTTADAGSLDADTVEAIESHRFEALQWCHWRNADLDFRSPEALLRSLEQPAPCRYLRLTRDGDDHRILAALAGSDAIRRRCTGRGRVRLLWEVCQVPDFEKSLTDAHTRLVATLFDHLSRGDAAGDDADTGGRLPADWVAGQIRRLDRADGDIDTLTARLAQVRTWTYIAHRADWLDAPGHWQDWVRGIEETLSDALHDRLIQRFVDRRIAVLTRRLEDGDDLLGAINRDGAVLVEGHAVGQIDGFTFTADDNVAGEHTRPLMAAARRALSGEIPRRLARCLDAADTAFTLTDQGRLLWDGSAVARLGPGDDLLAPRVVLPVDDLLDGARQEKLRHRLTAFLTAHLAARLAPLVRLRREGVSGATGSRALTGPGRGLVFQVCEALGSLPLTAARDQVAALTTADRQILKRLGIVIGFDNVFLPALLKPAPAALRGLLWAVAHRQPPPATATLPAQRVSLTVDEADQAAAYYQAIGYRRTGPRWIRVDMHDRLVAAVRRHAVGGAFEAAPDLIALAGCRRGDIADVLLALGCRRARPGEVKKALLRRAGAAPPAPPTSTPAASTPASPTQTAPPQTAPTQTAPTQTGPAEAGPVGAAALPDMFVLKPRRPHPGSAGHQPGQPAAGKRPAGTPTRTAKPSARDRRDDDPASPFAKLRDLVIRR